MTSEWMKVMLDEIARKKSVAESERAEFERRRAEQESAPGAGPATPAAPATPATPATRAAPAAMPAAQGSAADDSA